MQNGAASRNSKLRSTLLILSNYLAWLILALSVLTLREGLAFADGTIQVVESVPLETTLAVPGIAQTQQVWLDMISSAKTSIDFEQFYISNKAGASLDPVIQAIEAAAARGVKIRFLTDAKFYQTYPDTVNQIGQTANCESRTIDFSSLGGVQHSKYFIVDGKDAFVGSQNFDWRSLSHIHEVGLRVNDAKVISDLQLIFEKDWAQGTAVGQQYAGFAMPAWADVLNALHVTAGGRDAGTDPLYVAASPAVVNPSGIPDTLSVLTRLMDNAQQSIQIQVMEYTTSVYGSSSRWKALDSAVRKAASRGVQVQLMVDVSSLKSGKSDLKSLARLNNVKVMVVTIPQYSGGPIPYARLIHSKYMIVDGSIGWVGSENWTKSYFTDTRDVGLVVQSSDVVSQLSQIFDQVWGSSYGTRM